MTTGDFKGGQGGDLGVNGPKNLVMVEETFGKKTYERPDLVKIDSGKGPEMKGAEAAEGEFIRIQAQQLGVSVDLAERWMRREPGAQRELSALYKANGMESLQRDGNAFAKFMARVLPSEMAGETTDPKTVSYFKAIYLGKVFRKAAMNAVESGQELDLADACWERSLDFYIRAFSEFEAEYLFSDTVNEMNDYGILEKFPDKVQALFEVGVRTCRRVEVFDGYYEFMKSIGRADQVKKFVVENLEVFLRMPIGVSTIFSDILKSTPEGDRVRLEMLSRQYNRGRKADPFTYLFCYKLCYKGNYRGTSQVLAETKDRYRKKKVVLPLEMDDVCRDLVPAFTYYNANRVFGGAGVVGSTKAWGVETDHRPEGLHVDEIRRRMRSEQAMVHAGDKFFGLVEKIEKERQQVSVEEAIDCLAEVYGNSDVVFGSYYDFLVYFLDYFLSIQLDAESVEKMLEAHDSGKIRIPIEVMNATTANLVKMYFLSGKYQEVVDLVKKRNPSGDGEMQMLRGTAYYFLKSSLAISKDGEDVDRAFREVSMRMDDFAGEGFEEDFEREIWADYFIPNYYKYPEVLNSNYNRSRAVTIVRDVVEKSPAVVGPRIVYLNLLCKQTSRDVAGITRCAIELNQLVASNGCDAEWKEFYQSTNKKAVEILYSCGQAVSVVEIIEADKSLISDPWFVEFLIKAKVHSSVLSRESYEGVQDLLSKLPEVSPAIRRVVETARKSLKIAEYSSCGVEPFVMSALEGENLQASIDVGDSVKVSYALATLKSFRKEFVGLAGNSMDLLPMEDQETHVRDASVGALRSIFGVDKVMVARKDEGFKMTCLTEGEGDDFTAKKVEFEIGADYKVVLPKMRVPPEKEAEYRVLIGILESALMEELLAVTMDMELHSVDEVLACGGRSYNEYLDQVNRYSRAKESPERQGAFGIEKRNEEIVEQLETFINELGDSDLSSGDEALAMVASLTEIIATCRDLDEPQISYKSSVDPESSFSGVAKFLEIFGGDQAVSVLKEMGVTDEIIETQYRLPKKDKNNFRGYYELCCIFPEKYKIKTGRLAVFLDDRGVATIPGVPKTHPLYVHIWALVLESLASKVVPEMGPYAKAFGHKRADSDKRGRVPRIVLHRYPEWQSDDDRNVKRLACSAIIINAQKGGVEKSGGRNAFKLALLDRLSEAFNLAELSSKEGLANMPLYFEQKTDDGKKGHYKRVNGLFVSNGGANCVNVDVLSGIAPEIFADGSMNEKIVMIQGKRVVAIDDLSPTAVNYLQSFKLRILGPRVFRLPIDFEDAENYAMDKYEVREIDGQKYWLIPAKYRSKHHVVIDGRPYKKKPYVPHSKVKVGPKTYAVTSFRMTDEMRDLYESSTVDMGKATEEKLYGVIYDKVTGEIYAYACLGSGEKVDENGEFRDLSSRVAWKLHQDGQPALMKFPKIKAAMKGREDSIAEVLFILESNKGYKRGKYIDLWKMLVSGRGLQDMAARMLLQMVGNGKGSKVSEVEEEKEENGVAEVGQGAVEVEEVSGVVKGGGDETVDVQEVDPSEPKKKRGRKRRVVEAEDDDAELSQFKERVAAVIEDLGKTAARDIAKPVEKEVDPEVEKPRKKREASSPRARFTDRELVESGDDYATYVVDPWRDKDKESSGLWDTDLRILPKEDPRYERFADAFDLKIANVKAKAPEEEYVLVVLNRGAGARSEVVSKVRLGFLVRKKREEF